MKTVSVTEFKSHCLEFLNEVGRTGEPLLLTKRGKPSAMVSRPPVEDASRIVFGKFKANGRIVGDLPWLKTLR